MGSQYVALRTNKTNMNNKKIKEEYIKSIIKEYDSTDWKKMQFNSIFYSILNRSVLLMPKVSAGFELLNGESEDLEDKEGYKKAIINGYIPLVGLVNLFRYLEKSNLISFIPYYNNEFIDHVNENFKVICPDIDEEKEHKRIKQIEEIKPRFTIKDSSIVEFLDEKYSTFVSISPELRDLVKRDFKSIEQIQFEQELKQANVYHRQAMEAAQKQICYSRWAFIVALVTLLITLGFNIFGTIKVESRTIENQLKQIIIQQKPPDIIKTEIMNDTLKVKVLKSKKKRIK